MFARRINQSLLCGFVPSCDQKNPPFAAHAPSNFFARSHEDTKAQRTLWQRLRFLGRPRLVKTAEMRASSQSIADIFQAKKKRQFKPQWIYAVRRKAHCYIQNEKEPVAIVSDEILHCKVQDWAEADVRADAAQCLVSWGIRKGSFYVEIGKSRRVRVVPTRDTKHRHHDL